MQMMARHVVLLEWILHRHNSVLPNWPVQLNWTVTVEGLYLCTVRRREVRPGERVGCRNDGASVRYSTLVRICTDS